MKNTLIITLLALIHIGCDNPKKQTDYPELSKIITSENNVTAIMSTKNSNSLNSIKLLFQSEIAANYYYKAINSLSTSQFDSALINMKKSYHYEKSSLTSKDLGGLFININELDSAEKYLLESIKIDSTSSLPLNSYGLLLNRQKKFQSALAFFDSAIKFHPKTGNPELFSVFFLNKAYSYYGLYADDSACVYLKKVNSMNLRHLSLEAKELANKIPCNLN